MLANVSEQVWRDFDLNIAIFLDSIAYWIKHNAANKLPYNYHEGRYWTYNTIAAYTKMFPGWSTQNIRTIIKKCIKNGLLITSNFNKKGFDRTRWYSLTEKALKYYPNVESLIYLEPDNPLPDSFVSTNKSFVRSNQPIPITNTTLSNNINIINSESQNSRINSKKNEVKNGNELLKQLIQIYREVFPNNPQPHPRLISTELQKTLKGLIKKWPEIDPTGKSLTPEAFRRYLTVLKLEAPKFSLGEYETQSGIKKKNGLVTFARVNTVIKFLEKAYS